MIEFKITHGNLSYMKSIPTGWHEVTFRQFCELAECGEDYGKVLSVFTGMDTETLKKARMTGVDRIIQVLSFLATVPNIPIPDKILGYKVAPDLGLETIEQYENLKEHIEKMKGATDREHFEQYPLYCAIYACPHVNGEYDWDKAQTLSKYFFDAPALEVLAVGNFTLVRLIELKNNIKRESKKPLTRMQRKKQEYQLWLKHMAFTGRFYFWKVKHLIKGTSF